MALVRSVCGLVRSSAPDFARALWLAAAFALLATGVLAFFVRDCIDFL